MTTINLPAQKHKLEMAENPTPRDYDIWKHKWIIQIRVDTTSKHHNVLLFLYFFNLQAVSKIFFRPKKSRNEKESQFKALRGT